MSLYDLDLDYTIPMLDISTDELKEIIAAADRIICENLESNGTLAIAYLKKAQSMQKIEETRMNQIGYTDQTKIPVTDKEIQNIIREIIEKALELSPDMPEALMQMGKVFMSMPESNNEHLEKAIAMYSRAIEIKSDYPAAYNNRGIAYGPSSNDLYRIYIQDASNNNNYIINRSYNNNLEKAIVDYTEALRFRPHDPVYYYNRGREYSESKEYKNASDDYSNAINYGTDEFIMELMLFGIRGNEYMKLKDYQKAINDFSISIRLNPDIIELLLLRGKCYLLSREYERAIVDLTEFKRLKIIRGIPVEGYIA